MTTFAAFLQSLDEPDPPPGLAGPLLALWHAEKGEWEAAHRKVLNDIFWRLRTGSPWADIPSATARQRPVTTA